MLGDASTRNHLKSFILAETEQNLAIELFRNNVMLFSNIVLDDENESRHARTRSEVFFSFPIRIMILIMMLSSENRK